MKMFFAWADRLDLVNALPGFIQVLLGPARHWEHTWVTTYEPVNNNPPNPEDGEYWYCNGSCHLTQPANGASRLLCQGEGDEEFAKCIGKPNDEHATLRSFEYRKDGLCHQMANRLLYATISVHDEPLKVENAKGYNMSVTFYGEYGGRGRRGEAVRAAWERLKTECMERDEGV